MTERTPTDVLVERARAALKAQPGDERDPGPIVDELASHVTALADRLEKQGRALQRIKHYSEDDFIREIVQDLEL